MKKAIVGFIFGAIAGAAVSFKYAEDKYKKIADEEIASVKATFKKDEPVKREKDISDEQRITTNADYEKILEDLNYTKKHTDYSGYSKKEDDEVVKMTPEEKPYKISVHEFGVYEHYSQVSCLYFTDKVLVEEMNMELLEDVDGAIGLNNLNDFEDEYIDAVYVRNDRLQIDYEILRDWRTYSEAIKTKPRLQED